MDIYTNSLFIINNIHIVMSTKIIIFHLDFKIIFNYYLDNIIFKIFIHFKFKKIKNP